MLRTAKTSDREGETPAMNWAPAAGTPREEESREFLQGRLASFGKVGALFYLSVGLARSLVLLASPQPEDWALHAVNRAMLAAAAALGAVWLASRSGRRAAGTLHWIDAAGLVLAGLAFASLGHARTPFFDTGYPMVLAAGYTILARAVMVPSTPRRTLGVSLAAIAPVVLAAFFLASGAVPSSDSGAMEAVVQAIWSLVAVGLAALASRVIYGLRVEAREARQVGQYALEAKLGEGGMGVVYRARHALLKRPTAVKLLPPEKAGATGVERFEREVQLTARLTHPNTVAIFDYGRTLDGVFYYAMEYVEGTSLEALVAEHGPQPPARVVRILKQVCGALAEAHALGLVHRDIKPANIVLGERGGVPEVPGAGPGAATRDRACTARRALRLGRRTLDRGRRTCLVERARRAHRCVPPTGRDTPLADGGPEPPLVTIREMTTIIAARGPWRENLCMHITASTLVADIAARHPRSIEVFERHGIDFCCGGRRPLGEVCHERRVSADTVAAELAAAASREQPSDRVWTDAPLGELLDHIVFHYHAALREDLPRLGRMADKVAEVHGSRHPELPEVAGVYRELKGELDPHLVTEEEKVFPAVRRLAEPSGATSGKLQAALHALELEHDRAGAALARLRALSSGFSVPDDGCNTYRALYEALLRFERELHEHVHLENNVLFPRVVSLAAHAARPR